MAYQSADELMFGHARSPVRCGFDLEIGNARVLPEINFTLPGMQAGRDDLDAILEQYQDMVNGVLCRLVALDAPGAVIEFEHLPMMTEEVEIGTAVTELLHGRLQAFYEQHGLRSALRVTVCDIREKTRPPRMRDGSDFHKMLDSLRESAVNGAHLLSIESTGGKEVSDRALLEADIPGLLLAIGILAPRDVRFLWHEITLASAHTHAQPAGDSGCAFGNTAMVLADQGHIPKVLAAVVRAMSSVRTWAAHESGALGPTKDCAYEGLVVKAITGCPASMEGKSAACAHFSHMGNIAMAACDLWSNESVQNTRLLSGYAPEVFTEILNYDCRLMNEALRTGQGRQLQSLLVGSDVRKSVHALIISPRSAFEIASAIVAQESDFARVRAAGLRACQLIQEASDMPWLSSVEMSWLERIETALKQHSDEQQILETGLARYAGVYLPEEYGL